MSIDWKPVAVSALLAFIIAVVTAGISGIPFGVLLLRAVLGALIFGAGAVGVQFLVAKFLPELVNPSEESPQTGGSVDIVVSDEDEEEEPLAAPSEEDDESSFRPGIPAASVETGGEPLVEEVEEADAGLDGEATEALPADDVGETESVAEADEQSEAAVAATDSAVDTLPDVGEFTDSFMADAAHDAPPQDTAEPTGDGQDPESIAKAIRTLMKREES